MNLYSFPAEFAALVELLDDDNATVADHDVIAAWWKEYEGALETKLDGCVLWIREQEAMAAFAKEEAARLTARAKVCTNRVERLKETIKFVFESQDLKRIETKHGTVTLATAGGKQALAIVVPVEELPAEFVTVPEPQPNTEAIRARLEAGEALPFAHLKPRSTSIRVK